jgi:hypothetical protein
LQARNIVTCSSLKLDLIIFIIILRSNKALVVFILFNLKAILLPEKIMVAGNDQPNV